MSALLEGTILGLSLSLIFGFGPALFALIQTSIHRGFWSGVLLAFGVFLSDVALVALGFLGVVQLFNKPENQVLFGVIGGIMLIIIGTFTIMRKIHLPSDENGKNAVVSKPNPLTYVLKGFFINMTNPFVWIFWMSIVVGYTTNYNGTWLDLWIIFGAALGTVFAMDVLKCFSSYKIKKYLQPHYIIWINRIAGICLVLFGVFLIIRTFLELA